MIKFNFTFKIIKSKSKKNSLTKKVPLFRCKSKALRGQKGKAQEKQHGRESGLDTWHVHFPKKPFLLGIKT